MKKHDSLKTHDDVIKWKHFPRNWPFVRGKFTVPRWVPRTKASEAGLWCFFDIRLNKRLCKQSWGWWFETLSRLLWRLCNGHIKGSAFPAVYYIIHGFFSVLKKCNPMVTKINSLCIIKAVHYYHERQGCNQIDQKKQYEEQFVQISSC